MQRRDYTTFDPVMDDPQADAKSLTNLADVQRSGGKRWASDTMLVADPSNHADGERPAGRACLAIAFELRDDFMIIM
ncbi:hypothetical protein CQ13_38845 [Bradyrhizobium retamae]|uniref:Uncharacterized protein n=1 Tax=Bradyrhizobium retamae TaxID=1300035 RepID=A0A0R3NGT3_9BRAD|nr:hypothetical protein CQ13_38845 [Bradyrhizobium retamae]